MGGGDDEKHANHRLRGADRAPYQSNKPLIVQDKSTPSAQRPAADPDRGAAPDERHRAWLRQVVRREK
jgi:hypothetical protein